MKPFESDEESRSPRKSGARERDFDELLESAEIRDFFFRAEREMFPKMRESALSVNIFSGKIDCKLCLETGAAILMDKPIIAVILKGAKVPENLRRCAHAIVEVSGLQTEEDRSKVSAAIQSVMRKFV